MTQDPSSGEADEPYFLSESSATLQALLNRYNSGDKTAREELASKVNDYVCAMTHRMLRAFPRVRRWEQTVDVGQNVMIRVQTALDSARLATVSDLYRFSVRLIGNELIDLARHYYGPLGLGANHASVGGGGDASGEIPGIAPVPVTADDPARLCEQRELLEKIGELRPELALVIALRHFRGLKRVQIAAILEVSQRTVNRYYIEARKELQRLLGSSVAFPADPDQGPGK